MTPVLQTKYVFTITAHIADVTTAGDIGSGVRRIIPITGGEVKGEGINGKVCPFGADFQIIRPNELIELEAKYAFETDDGAVVYVENKGIRFGPVELMQQLITAIFPGGGPRTYDKTGRLPANHLPQRSLYESVG